jgi:hypothetical protein
LAGGFQVTPEIYMPMVYENYGAAGGIANGDFESGRTAWFEYSLQGYELIMQAAGLPVPPHSGNWAVWLGGAYDEVSYIEQQVTVPADRPYLGYYHWIASEDTCGYDFGGVIVSGLTADVYDLCQAENTGGWVKHVVDLRAYAGQSVSLQIRAQTDESLNSSLFIDNVAFQASATAAGEGPLDPDTRGDPTGLKRDAR